MKCSAIFRRQVTNSFPHFSFECSFLRMFFFFFVGLFSFGSIKFSHGKHFLLGFFSMVFLVYLREQRKKKVLLSVFFFSAVFFFWLGYANLQCCLCLFLTMCVCVWLWFSSRFLLLLLSLFVFGDSSLTFSKFEMQLSAEIERLLQLHFHRAIFVFFFRFYISNFHLSFVRV